LSAASHLAYPALHVTVPHRLYNQHQHSHVQQCPMKTLTQEYVCVGSRGHRGRRPVCGPVLPPGSPFLTPVGTPDTLSESGSVKSGRSRRALNSSRTLPFLPPEEPAPLPSQAKSKTGSDRMKAFANFRQSSLDGLRSAGGYGGLSRPRPSNSETNLRKLALEERSRPVSALGLLQGWCPPGPQGPAGP